MYRKFRFTLRFLLGNLHDFDPEVDAVDFEALPLADRYMLHRLGRLLGEVEASYAGYQFFRAYQACNSCITSYVEGLLAATLMAAAFTSRASRFS